MLPGDLLRLRPHRLHVQAHEGAVPAIARPLQHVHLVEGAPQVHGAEGLVLVVLQPILVVQVHAPQLPVPERVGELLGGVEPGQDGMR